MRIDPRGVVGSRLIALGARLVRLIVAVLGRSCRRRSVEGAEHLARLRAEGRAAVLSFWHERSILAAPYILGQLVRRDGHDVTMLISHSRDGELVSRLAHQWRLRQVRGSASRGGAQALRALYRLMRRERTSPIMIPDGPRGPAHQFKVGVAVLAQLAEAPVLPMAFAARRAWRLRSWDRLIVPRPFTVTAVVIGAPREVPRDLDPAALEALRAGLEAELDALTARAEQLAAAP